MRVRGQNDRSIRRTVARRGEHDAPADRIDLGLGLNRAATTRVRAPFRGLAAADFQVFEADGRKRFRLNPAIVLEKTDWVTIAQHPEPAIAGIAEKALRRKGK